MAETAARQTEANDEVSLAGAIAAGVFLLASLRWAWKIATFLGGIVLLWAWAENDDGEERR